MRPFGWKMFGIVSSPNPNHICAHLQRVCRTTTCRMLEFFLQNSSCPLARIGSNKSLIQTCSSWCTYVYTESVPVSEMHMLQNGQCFCTSLFDWCVTFYLYYFREAVLYLTTPQRVVCWQIRRSTQLLSDDMMDNMQCVLHMIYLTDVSNCIIAISEKQFSILPLHQELSASEYTGALSCCLTIAAPLAAEPPSSRIQTRDGYTPAAAV